MVTPPRRRTLDEVAGPYLSLAVLRIHLVERWVCRRSLRSCSYPRMGAASCYSQRHAHLELGDCDNAISNPVCDCSHAQNSLHMYVRVLELELGESNHSSRAASPVRALLGIPLPHHGFAREQKVLGGGGREHSLG